MQYSVFTSYAVLDRTKNMVKFITDLRDVLRTKLGVRQAEEIEKLFFFDFQCIRAGDEWSQTIREAVCGARTLVCLVSPTYLGSEWCGKELEIFHQRFDLWKVSREENHGRRFIFPIVWEPDTKRQLPKKLKNFQHREPGVPPRYEAHGLRQLADRSKFRNDYKDFVDVMAESIKGALDAPEDEDLPALTVELESLQSAFAETPLPYDVFLWAITPNAEAWKPLSNESSVAAATGKAAASLRVYIHPFKAEQNSVHHFKTLMRQRQILLIVADADTPPIADFDILNGMNENNPMALVLVDAKANSGSPTRTVSNWLNGLPDGRLHRAVRDQHAVSCVPAHLAVEIEKVVLRLRLALISADPPARAEDPKLAEIAEAQGIITASKPTLSGPGSSV